MDKENLKVRNKLKSVSTYKTFYQILDGVILSDEERKIVEMFYLENKSFDYIASELGMSRITVARRHKKILSKLVDSI